MKQHNFCLERGHCGEVGTVNIAGPVGQPEQVPSDSLFLEWIHDELGFSESFLLITNMHPST